MTNGELADGDRELDVDEGALEVDERVLELDEEDGEVLLEGRVAGEHVVVDHDAEEVTGRGDLKAS